VSLDTVVTLLKQYVGDSPGPGENRDSNHKVENLVNTGKLPKIGTRKCRECGAQADVYHHPNHAKATSVIPLCNGCHGKRTGRGE
jgi:hypothetical protein